MDTNIFSKIDLNDGRKMPGYGYGVYKAAGEELLAGMECALACGYRYIDTASFYENEKEVGKAARDSGIAREDLYIVSKIWPTEFIDPAAALDRSLKRLGMDYLDAYLLHWPGLDEQLRLKTFEKLLNEKEKGKILSLGVSNFLEIHLENLHKNFGFWPAMNQIEVHPRHQERDLCNFCMERDIRIVSWAPLGRGGGMLIPEIIEIARSLSKTPAQTVLRWHIQKHYAAIPKSVHAERIRENADVFDFCLSKEQMRIIDALDLPGNQGRTGKNPLDWPPVN